ncbi:MAG TPA: bifunctional riboflavin kinase/FAD synthetase [Bacteriovoracaceae bacterium]|nr:bifunctional riboflavin kinase/FAD synthetase [Bacteriovoracaceae bacterium]
MKVIHNITDIPKGQKLGITIGNFDGVHIGHQHLLDEIRKKCDAKGLSFVVVTFVPHPQKILCPGKDRFLISSYNYKRTLLEEQGVDYLIEIEFNRDFSTLSPEEFLKNYLLPHPGLEDIYLGYDFAFGANKQGDFDIVKNTCKNANVEIQPKYEFAGQTVSSTLIRKLIEDGELKKVEGVLGRPFRLEGTVIKGEGRGKKIGFPTANILISTDLIIPAKGVYVSRTTNRGMTYNSITNIGNNPTFNNNDGLYIETHLFDFDDYLYGEVIEVELYQKLRDEKKFSSVNELVDQIKKDIEKAKEVLCR